MKKKNKNTPAGLMCQEKHKKDVYVEGDGSVHDRDYVRNTQNNGGVFFQDEILPHNKSMLPQ